MNMFPFLEKESTGLDWNSKINIDGAYLVDNKILIEPVKVDKKTESGIIIPDTAIKDTIMDGFVIMVGRGYVTNEMDVTDKDFKYVKLTVEKGDRVMFDSKMATKVRIQGTDCYVMTEQDILIGERINYN